MNLQSQQPNQAWLPMHTLVFRRVYLWYLVPVLVNVLCITLLVSGASSAWQMPLNNKRYILAGLYNSDLLIAPFRWTHPTMRLQLPALFIGRQQVSLQLQSGRQTDKPLKIKVESGNNKSVFLAARTSRTYRFLSNTQVLSGGLEVRLDAPVLRKPGSSQKLGIMLGDVHVYASTVAVPWWHVTLVAWLLQLTLIATLTYRLFKRTWFTSVLLTLWTPIQFWALSTIIYTQRASIVAYIACGAIIAVGAGVYTNQPALRRFYNRLVDRGYIPQTIDIERLYRHFRLRNDIVIQPWVRTDWLIACGFALAAVLVRVPMINGVVPLLNGDDYEPGTLAVNILHGNHLLYYGWRVGTLTAYLVAPLFLVAPTTLPILLVLPITLSAVLIIALYGVGRDLLGRWGGIGAAAWMTLPSATAMLWSMKPQPGYLEVITLGTLLLWAVLRLFHAEMSRAAQIRLMVVIGILTAAVMWVNFVIISVLAACGWIALASRRRLAQLPRVGYIVGGGVFVALWLVPLLIYAANHPNANPLWYALHPPYNQASLRVAVSGFTNSLLPLLIGISSISGGRIALGYAIVIALCLSVLAPLVLILYRLRCRDYSTTIILLMLFLPMAAFLLSSFRYLLSDVRYILPLYIAIPLLIGSMVCFLRRLRGGVYLAPVLLVCIMLVNSVSTFRYVGVAKPYVVRNEAAIARVLQQREVHSIYASFWIGMGIMFESGGSVVSSAEIGPARTTIDPRYEAHVTAADKKHTAFIFRSDGAAYTSFNQFLQAQHIVCQHQNVRNYVIYMHCTPFPDMSTLIHVIPEYSE